MKSQTGRRWRDVVEGLLAEFGDIDSTRIRELASLKIAHEVAQTAAINGDIAACDQIVRISHLITRKERELRARKAAVEAAMPRKPLRERILSAQASRRAAPSQVEVAGLVAGTGESSVDGPSPSVGGAVPNRSLREYAATRSQRSDGGA